MYNRGMTDEQKEERIGSLDQRWVELRDKLKSERDTHIKVLRMMNDSPVANLDKMRVLEGVFQDNYSRLLDQIIDLGSR